jgi:hypothetical protein
MEISNSMIDEMWRTETIRVGNAEITVERDIDTGELKEESEHLGSQPMELKKLRPL